MTDAMIFPPNPIDGQQVADTYGNIYQYNSEEDSWIKLGVKITPNIVTVQSDGLITPAIYTQLSNIKENLSIYSKTKIYIGGRNNNPYFYYFHSTDGTISFKPFIQNDKKILQIEADRARILANFNSLSCAGPIGPKGATGIQGKNGLPADNEKWQSPNELTETTAKITTSVETPIDTSISLRLYDNKVQKLEILINLDGAYIVNESGWKMSVTESSIQYQNNVINAIIKLSEGKFNTQIFMTRFKIRQRGAKGETGSDGKSFLDVLTKYSSEAVYESMIWRIDNDNDDILYSSVAYTAPTCASTFKLLTAAQQPSIYALAVEQITGSCKRIGYSSFGDEVIIPNLDLPSWTPNKACATHRIWEMSNFRWFTDLKPVITECFEHTALPAILTCPEPPAQCCKDDFFYCPNLGDFCQIAGKNPTPIIRPETWSSKVQSSSLPPPITEITAPSSSSSSSSSLSSSLPPPITNPPSSSSSSSSSSPYLPPPPPPPPPSSSSLSPIGCPDCLADCLAGGIPTAGQIRLYVPMDDGYGPCGTAYNSIFSRDPNGGGYGILTNQGPTNPCIWREVGGSYWLECSDGYWYLHFYAYGGYAIGYGFAPASAITCTVHGRPVGIIPDFSTWMGPYASVFCVSDMATFL